MTVQAAVSQLPGFVSLFVVKIGTCPGSCLALDGVAVKQRRTMVVWWQGLEKERSAVDERRHAAT